MPVPPATRIPDLSPLARPSDIGSISRGYPPFGSDPSDLPAGPVSISAQLSPAQLSSAAARSPQPATLQQPIAHSTKPIRSDPSDSIHVPVPSDPSTHPLRLTAIMTHASILYL
ncbi:hypothetical protein BO71DRAFT_105484 [Aspergillus ellipticus CBS 707.79]|uniref:Uncharacterized protein n=1 Tax=Aspergillus ellipticus CBS 707.79 TaxID=1448320 RepID=A0A319CWA9_9EURO|nr:hypothetical protein BO71DRAFT_105484 [Aspergillus ellipticus CBS 707.79]